MEQVLDPVAFSARFRQPGLGGIALRRVNRRNSGGGFPRLGAVPARNARSKQVKLHEIAKGLEIARIERDRRVNLLLESPRQD